MKKSVQNRQFKLERNTYVQQRVLDPTQTHEIEVGDIKQDEFKPQLKTKHWDNEANFSLRLIGDYTPHDVVEEDGFIEWRTAECVARFYDKDTGDEHGGFELELEFDDKPKSNVVQFSVRSKNLAFHYQPELTEEEIADGCVRPDNVVGSYAVYHKTQRNHIEGQKNYKTGKAFHIYRPYAFDKTGRKVWCDLQIDEQAQILTIIVPQNFIDTATYPVIVDPTFGYTTAGASSDFTNKDVFFGSQHDSTADGTVSQMHCYADGVHADTKFRISYYTETDRVLRGYSEEGTLETAGFVWHDVNVASGGIINDATSYVIGWVHGQQSTGTVRFDAVSGRGRSTNMVYGIPDDPAGTFSTNARLRSIYLTYTGQGAVTQSLKYTVKVAAAVTKALQYLAFISSGITKSLQYVMAVLAGRLSTDYIKIAGKRQVTKSLQYKVHADVYQQEGDNYFPHDEDRFEEDTDEYKPI